MVGQARFPKGPTDGVWLVGCFSHSRVLRFVGERSFFVVSVMRVATSESGDRAT